MTLLQGQSFIEALASSRARIGELEREAIDRTGDAEAGARASTWSVTNRSCSPSRRSSGRTTPRARWSESSRAGPPTPDRPSTNTAAGAGSMPCIPRIARPPSPCGRVPSSRWRPYELEHRLRRHDGKYRYFSVRAVPVLGDDGTIREWAGIHTDITERKLTEQTLRDGERQFRELADSMPQIVWAAGPDGHFDYYNRRWYEFTGRPEGISGDESWTDVVHPDDQNECLARWHSATHAGRRLRD